MTIDNEDVKQIITNRGLWGEGDSVVLSLENPDGKYNELINKDVRLSSFIRLNSGYDASLIPVFTGRTFVVNVEHGVLPETINITLLDRNSFLEKSKMTSDYYSNKTVTELITEFAYRYFGYEAGELSIDAVFSSIQ